MHRHGPNPTRLPLPPADAHRERRERVRLHADELAGGIESGDEELIPPRFDAVRGAEDVDAAPRGGDEGGRAVVEGTPEDGDSDLVLGWGGRPQQEHGPQRQPDTQAARVSHAPHRRRE
jgi:hypothetical protein